MDWSIIRLAIQIVVAPLIGILLAAFFIWLSTNLAGVKNADYSKSVLSAIILVLIAVLFYALRSFLPVWRVIAFITMTLVFLLEIRIFFSAMAWRLVLTWVIYQALWFVLLLPVYFGFYHNKDFNLNDIIGQKAGGNNGGVTAVSPAPVQLPEAPKPFWSNRAAYYDNSDRGKLSAEIMAAYLQEKGVENIFVRWETIRDVKRVALYVGKHSSKEEAIKAVPQVKEMHSEFKAITPVELE